jgi:DNA-binding transcriptional MocR family regulator
MAFMSVDSIRVDRLTDHPLYLQVADQIRTKIEQGDLPPDTRLPASRTLAKRLGVNRITVVNAYSELEAEGVVVTRVGSGTYVAARTKSNIHPAIPPTPLRWRSPLAMRRYWSSNQMMAEMMRLARQPGVISFAGGAPASDFLPVNEFRRALNDVLRRDGAEALQYESAAGYFPLREVIATQLQRQDIQVSGEDVLITAGCQQAADIALRVLARSDNSVLMVEDPCYLGLLDLVTSRRITPVPVPMDDYGIQTEQLEQIILRHHPRLIYVTPTFHNPTGRTLPLNRRRELLRIATRYGIPILEDSSYVGLRFNGDRFPSLKSLDSDEIVFYAGGFSKTLVPGLRIGFLVAPVSLQERMIATKQTADILTSPLNQRALHAYLTTVDFSQHLVRVQEAYQYRRDVMVAAMKRYFPDGARWLSPDGGIYLWVEMPEDGPTATELYLTGINYNVAFAIGSVFSASGTYDYAMRFNFAVNGPEMIEEGIRRLGKAWYELLGRFPKRKGHRPQQTTVQIL